MAKKPKRTSGKPATPKASPKSTPKPAPKPTAKAARTPKPRPKAKPAVKPASRGTKAAASEKGRTTAATARPRGAKAVSTEPKPKARAVQAAVTARPAPKPHVHAAAAETEAVRGRSRAAVPAPGPSYAGIGDDAVRKATGKGWEDWLALLDGAGATTLEHKAIAALLHDSHEVGDWWSQMITVGYEQARGLREKHQTASGYQASMSKTIGAPVAKLYKAWAEESERERWLGAVPVEVRVANQDKNIRLTWLKDGPEHGTSVEVGFFAREGGRGMVQVQQNKLADAEAVARVKAFWSVKLETLRAALEK